VTDVQDFDYLLVFKNAVDDSIDVGFGAVKEVAERWSFRGLLGTVRDGIPRSRPHLGGPDTIYERCSIAPHP
jgi:hypothetical protein